MNTNTNVHRPEPLADFLARGGDPAEELRAGWLHPLVDLLADLSTTLPEHRERLRQAHVWEVEQHLAGELAQPQECVTMMSWCADVYADPTLAKPLLDRLPDVLRAEVASLTDCRRSTHPLRVEPQTDVRGPSSGRRCEACGTLFEEDELAMTIGHAVNPDGTPYADPEPYRRAWCEGCVTIVVEVMRAARGD